jgi:DNA-binding NtrC family response regulator
MTSRFGWTPSSAIKNPLFTILVADGELSFDGVLDGFIKRNGHFVLRARTAAEAVAKALEFQPHVILLNCELDGGAGMGMLPELMRADTGVALVMMTRNPSVPEAVQAMRLGAADYLEMPLDPEKLRRAIVNQMAALSLS